MGAVLSDEKGRKMVMQMLLQRARERLRRVGAHFFYWLCWFRDWSGKGERCRRCIHRDLCGCMARGSRSG